MASLLLDLLGVDFARLFEWRTLPRMGGRIALIIFWIGTVGLFSMAIWGGWAEKVSEKDRERYWSWYWLRVFGVPPTQENRLRFVKGTSIFGLVLVTLMTLVVLAINK